MLLVRRIQACTQTQRQQLFVNLLCVCADDDGSPPDSVRSGYEGMSGMGESFFESPTEGGTRTSTHFVFLCILVRQAHLRGSWSRLQLLRPRVRTRDGAMPDASSQIHA